MVDPGAASSNPIPNMLHLSSVCFVAGEQQKFPKWKYVRSKKDPELSYGQIENCYKTYIFLQT